MRWPSCWYGLLPEERRHRRSEETLLNEGTFKFRSRMRMLTDGAVTGLAILATLLVVLPLVAIFGYLIYKGMASLNLDFFTKIPKPEGESGGGMANAVVG